MDAVCGKEAAVSGSFFTIDNDQIEIDAVKKSEDGKYLVVRFHDFAGAKQNVTLKPEFGFKAWAEGDLRERPLEEMKNTEIAMNLHPYEIKTLLFEI